MKLKPVYQSIGFNRDTISASLLASLLVLGYSATASANGQSAPKKAKKVAVKRVCKANCKHTHPPVDKKVRMKGITITPGGFIAMQGNWRGHAQTTDHFSSYNLTNGNNPLYYFDEMRFGARATLFSMLFEGAINPDTLAQGYFEFDFQGAAQTANSLVTDSYTPRLRHAFANIDWKDAGWHLTAGQTWSLATANSKGIAPLSVATPPVIETSFVPGYVYKRQPQVRLTKNWGKTVWASVSAENPLNTFAAGCGNLTSTSGAIATAGTVFGNVLNEFCTSNGQSGYNPSVLNYSFNHAPDVIGKIAFDPDFAGRKIHLEGIGIYRDIFNRVWYTNGTTANVHDTGYGFGGSGVLEVWPKFIDLQANVLAGRGVNSYGVGVSSDATIGNLGGPAPIEGVSFSAGAIIHATPALDLYVYGGQQKVEREYFLNTLAPAANTFIGYGVPSANNTGCTLEGAAAGTCNGSAQSLWQVTTGLWDNFYQGEFGQMKLGLQYSYTKKQLFSGAGSYANVVAGAPQVGYSTDVNMVYGAVRYFPFWMPAAKPAVWK